MLKSLRGLRFALMALIALGTLGGLIGAYARFHIEESNRRIEIALEWDEVSRLAQFIHQPIGDVLTEFKAVHVSTLVLQEDTFTTLEQEGAIHPTRTTLPDGRTITHVGVLIPVLYARIVAAIKSRGIPEEAAASAFAIGPETEFQGLAASAPGSMAFPVPPIYVPVDYSNLRTLGLGLPPDGCEAARSAGMGIAGRIGNYPGVDGNNAKLVLQDLVAQGAHIVIFSGEETLGYRNQEKAVAELLRDGIPLQSEPGKPPSYLSYGAVEFGKQKGDEKLSALLHGDFIRVHSIQAGEMGQLDEVEAIDRFDKAAKERNIRFCYVRLLTFAASDPDDPLRAGRSKVGALLKDNIEFLTKISKGMQHGSVWTGGDLGFGAARRYAEPSTPALIFPLLALGVAAGTVWMIALLCPLPPKKQDLLLVGLAVICVGLAVGAGETGRKLVALLAGISFPAAACLLYYPQGKSEKLAPWPCAVRAVKTLLNASVVTAIGIVHVVGLLAARSFMVHANQFMGIKAQHAIPLLIVALAATMGGVTLFGETWRDFKTRAGKALGAAMNEPARFGLLLFGLITLSALALVIARTGNDAGVGVSGFELKARSLLDRLMPVRPRTKEFLVGHPAFVLGWAWWLRGRRRLAIPAFVIGSLGQVSLLNTFCHIHTPLIISVWRDGTGLVLGAALGVALFLVIEKFAPPARADA